MKISSIIFWGRNIDFFYQNSLGADDRIIATFLQC